MILLSRAPAGGARIVDKVYQGGEFLPFYIPRARMPQVDEKDYPDLMKFLKGQNVNVTNCVAAPKEFHAHQRINFDMAIQMDIAVLNKPVLTSLDYYILDGNHRWMGHVVRETQMNVIKIGLLFDAAISMLFKFPKTYSYGDGNFHPISN